MKVIEQRNKAISHLRSYKPSFKDYQCVLVVRGSDTKLIYGDQAEGIQPEKTSPIINDKGVTSVVFSLQTKTVSAHTSYPLAPLCQKEKGLKTN